MALDKWVTILQTEWLKVAPKLRCSHEDFSYPGYEQVPKFIVDLDQDPALRWAHIVKSYIPELKILSEELDIEQLKEIGSTSVSTWIAYFCKSIQENKMSYLLDELKGIASITKEFGLSLSKLIILNMGYSLVARCTSGCVNGESVPYHFRTMDWDMEILRKLTIQVEFQKQGKTIFISTQWVGFVGILTGMRCNEWSISLNYRHVYGGSLALNLLSLFSSHDAIEFLIRHLLERETDFSKVVEILSRSLLIAPCYLTITGKTPGSGALITRDRKGEIHRLNIKEAHGEFLIQTNIDHWIRVVDPDWAGNDDLLKNSIDRRNQAVKILSKLDLKSITTSLFNDLIDIPPIMNYQTIYQVVMSPGDNFYESRCIKSVPRKSYQNLEPSQTLGEKFVEEIQVEKPLE